LIVNNVTLITLKNTASYQLVLKTAFLTKSPEELKLLDNFKSRSDSLPESVASAEKILLENPNHVLFASSMDIKAAMDNYPCLIKDTSTSVFRVRFLGLIQYTNSQSLSLIS